MNRTRVQMQLTNGPYKTSQKQTNNKNSRHVIPFSAPSQPNLNPPKSKAGDQFQPQIGASGRERPRIRDRRVVLPARERRGPRPRRPRGVALQEIQGEIASPRRALRLRNPVAPVPRRGRGRFRLGERWERRGPQSHLRELVAGAEGFWRWAEVDGDAFRGESSHDGVLSAERFLRFDRCRFVRERFFVLEVGDECSKMGWLALRHFHRWFLVGWS